MLADDAFSPPPPEDDSLKQDKSILRRALLDRRASIARGVPGGPEGAGRGAARRFCAALSRLPPGLWAPGAVLAGYWPIRDEMDPRPLMRRAAECGLALALPAVVGAQTPLLFRRWSFGEPLEEGAFGTLHPPGQAAGVTPSIVLAPVVGFDRAGGRIGYGGGFYDRALRRLRAHGAAPFVCAVAYGAQEVDRAPMGPCDQPLDAVATERTMIVFGSRAATSSKIGRDN